MTFRLGFFYAVLFGMVAVFFPYFPLFLAARGFGMAEIGIVKGAAEAAGMFGPLIAGRIADRTGKYRLVMGITVAVSWGCFLLLGSVGTLAGAIAAAILFGFFHKPINPLIDALSGRTLVSASRDYGRVRAWGSASFIAVSLTLQFTGILDGAPARRLLVAFLVAFGLLLLVVPMLPSTPPSRSREKNAGNHGFSALPTRFWSLVGIAFVGRLGLAAYYTFGSLYMTEVLGLSRVSGMFAIAALAETPVVFFGGRFLRRLGHRHMLALSFASTTLRFIVMALSRSVALVAVMQAFHAFTFGFYIVAGIDLVNRIVPEESRALGMSIFLIVSFGASGFLGSLPAGFIVESAGFGVLFMVYAVPSLAALAWLRFRRDIGATEYDKETPPQR